MTPTKSKVYQLHYVDSKNHSRLIEFDSAESLAEYLNNTPRLYEMGYTVSIAHNRLPFVNIHPKDIFIDEKSLSKVVQSKPDGSEIITGMSITFYVALNYDNDSIEKYSVSTGLQYETLEFTKELQPTIWEGIVKLKPKRPDLKLNSLDFFTQHIKAFVNLYLF